MKIEFIDVEYKNLGMKQECICFPELDSQLRKTLEEYSRGTTGIMIIKDGIKTVIVKFTYSSLGNDGSVQFLDFNDRHNYYKFAQISIQAYAIFKAIEATTVEA